MTSTRPTIGDVPHRLADLESVLTPLVPALEQLHTAQIEQRRLVVAGELGAIVTITTTIQDTSARIAQLEVRRQAIQSELEAGLGVQGLRAVLLSSPIAQVDRARLGQLLVQVTRLVREIRQQGQKNAALLDAAIGAAQRTRKVLERLSGADNTYDPVKARKTALRARANLTMMTSPALTGRMPGQAGKDVTSFAPGAQGREAS